MYPFRLGKRQSDSLILKDDNASVKVIKNCMLLSNLSVCMYIVILYGLK